MNYKGTNGDDYFDGTLGADRFEGLGGYDTFVINNPGDVIVEGEGSGVILASVSYTVPHYIRTIRLTGTANINATDGAYLFGNVGNNVLDGGHSSDRINGKEGNDTLIGGFGSDTFIFDTALSSGNVDKIVDFVVKSSVRAYDKIRLDNDVFVGLKGSIEGLALEDFRFKVIGYKTQTAGVDKSDRILYDRDDGNLYFDRDGSGTKYARIKFAEVADNTNLTAGDISIGMSDEIKVLGDVDSPRQGVAAQDNFIYDPKADVVVGDYRRFPYGELIAGNDRIELGDHSAYAYGDVELITDPTYKIVAGNDRIIGGAGDDYIYGEGEIKYYRVEDYHITGGNDTIYGQGGDDNIWGQNGGDKISGGSGDDRIDGGYGNDRLTGNAGWDVFVFSTSPNGKTNYDIIDDFSHQDDTFELVLDKYAWLKKGQLDASSFKEIGSSATKKVDTTDRILYDRKNGDLYHDQDGSGDKYSPVKFAVVKDGTVLDYTDFLIV